MAANTPTLSIRVPGDVRQKLEAIAKREHRSLGNLIVKVLTEYVERDDQANRDQE